MIKLLVIVGVLAVLWYTGILSFVLWFWGMVFMLIGAAL